jgi:multidrug resistance efflux pump
MSARTKWASAALALLAAAGSLGFLRNAQLTHVQASAPAKPIAAPATVVFASLGRVEGLSDTTEIGAAADGILKAVYVKEDQLVSKGTLLAEIDCDDLNAVLETALADAEAARQSRARLLRGTRDEEKRIAASKTAAARSTFEEAKASLHRQRMLFEGGQIARAAYDQSVRDLGVAQAEFQAAARNEQLLAAPPVREDKARADAQVVAAESRVQEVRERIRKCSIFAPIDGTVLRVQAKPGESFSTITPRPLFIMADASGRRIKAEVDERDLGKVTIGQSVIIGADGFGDKKFTGTVASISSVMGRKSIFADDPADKADTDIVETQIKLNDAAEVLPIGLRVTVQFLAADPHSLTVR